MSARMKTVRQADERNWSHRRLTNQIAPGLRVLFVGINPGVRSALTGHHFAGPSNRFWKLLAESRLVPERLTFQEDVDWGSSDSGSRTWLRDRVPESTI